MRKEKIILSVSAALIGILVAIGAFFFYQSTQQIHSTQIKKITIESPTPDSKQEIFLKITSPKDEDVSTTRTIKISGQTVPGAKLAIIGPTFEEGAVADKNGNFSSTVTLDNNENIIEITAFSEDGKSAKETRVVTYSTESF